MTKLLEKAIETMRELPAAQQDQIARLVLDLAENLDDDSSDDEDIDPAAIPGLVQGLADADAGRFATDEEIEAVYRRFEK